MCFFDNLIERIDDINELFAVIIMKITAKVLQLVLCRYFFCIGYLRYLYGRKVCFHHSNKKTLTH